MTAPLPPPAYVAHYRVTLSGHLGSFTASPEIFSFGFSTSRSLANAPANWQAGVFDACAAYFADPNVAIGANAFLTQVKISQKGAGAGKDDGLPFIRLLAGTPGGGPSSPYPFQTSLVVTLGAPTSRRYMRSRFYLPLPTFGVSGSTGRISGVSTVQNAADRTAAFLNAVETASGEKVVVASRTHGNEPITVVRIGDVYDTMRSRRNKLRETYSVAVAPLA